MCVCRYACARVCPLSVSGRTDRDILTGGTAIAKNIGYGGGTTNAVNARHANRRANRKETQTGTEAHIDAHTTARTDPHTET